MDDHYPVRRRGERRRLNPNTAGITWLETQSESDTEIYGTYDLVPGEGMRALRSHGARRPDPGICIRPMVAVLRDEHVFPSWGSVRRDPCPGCDDWSRTARCARHPELRLEDAVPPIAGAHITPLPVERSAARDFPW